MVSFKHQFLKSAQIKDDLKRKRILKKGAMLKITSLSVCIPFCSYTSPPVRSGKDMRSVHKHGSFLRQLILSEYSRCTAGWQIQFIWKLFSMESKLISCKNKNHTLQILISFISSSSKSQNNYRNCGKEQTESWIQCWNYLKVSNTLNNVWKG